MKDVILEMRHVTKRFPGVLALNDVSFSVRRGEIHAICGENGAGKSTLMKILSGSYSHNEYEGEIWVEGEKKEFKSVKDAKACGIEMVYQELNMMLDSSVAENIFVGNLPGGTFVDFKTLYEKTREILEQIHLEIDPRATVRSLNSGQMQMLAVMRAISQKCRIVVLDEPTTALTDKEVDLLFGFLNELLEKGVSCLLITHKLEEIFRICDRVTVVRDGMVISTGDVQEYTEDRIVEEMIGRKIENMYPLKASATGETVLSVKNLSIPNPSDGRRFLVKGINFELHKGEILGIGGLVGAGRSEICGAIFGQLTEGVEKEIEINGQQVSISSPADAIRYGIGFLTEERKTSGLIQPFSVMKNLSIVALKDLPKKFFIDFGREKSAVKEIFDQLRIKAPSIDTPITSLSGGNQQKVVLGKWIMKRPDILLMDEPTKGVDVGSKAEIYTIMRELTQSGVSIIMISSDMPELVSMSDRCLVVSGGHITQELTGEEITQENVMRAAIAG